MKPIFLRIKKGPSKNDIITSLSWIDDGSCVQPFVIFFLEANDDSTEWAKDLNLKLFITLIRVDDRFTGQWFFAGLSDDGKFYEGRLHIAHCVGEIKVVPMEKLGIEFRSGGFLQPSLDYTGGPAQNALVFDTEEEAKTFMEKHRWVCDGCTVKKVIVV